MLTRRAWLIVTILLVLAASQARTLSQSAAPVTSPRQQFGAAIGDDYFLATYTQLETYFKTLDRESDRMQLVDIGRTEEGRTQWMAIITAPGNFARLERYREISARLARAEGLSEEQARALAAEGKAIVWINGGLHASEVLGSHQLIELVYQLTSGTDDETQRILRDVVVLAAHANPDGHELVSSWYMREPDPLRRSTADLPRAYQKYVGHDNNRDFYMSTQAETININRVLYREWFPQIVYDHHQTGPAGTVMFAPPFRDPFNYVFDPLIVSTIDMAGAAMHARFAAENKRGVTMRRGATYSTWWNGGLRTTAYFHNQIGLLTETIGNPTPMTIPVVPARQVPSADLPFPIAPQRWHFRQSIDYSMTANRAVLDLAARYRETFLFNAYRMGRNAIERGSTDTWTMTPRRADAVRQRDPAARDPRGYVLPADQPDFPTAVKFVTALLRTGVDVHRATAPFTAAGRTYPAGSFVVKTAQAFRPHVLDMFEPQEHPDDIPYPGAAPTPPYDSAGWTLAFQMGVTFDRLLDPFDGPFERVVEARVPPGRIVGDARPGGYLLSHHQNDAFIVANRVLQARGEVVWPKERNGTGAMYIPARPDLLPLLQKAATDLGVTLTGVRTAPGGDAFRLRPVRVGLWDRYGGAASSGWIRWLLERYEFPFEVVYPQALDAGDLASRFDVLIFPDEAAFAARAPAIPPNLPAEYQPRTGALTTERTLPALRAFVEQGGTLLTIGGGTRIGEALGVPATAEAVRTLGREQYYIPGSVLRVSVDNTTPLGYGFESQVDVFFENSPAFRVTNENAGVQRVAWFASAAPLRSGWAWGQQHLDGALAVVDAPLGKGRVVMFGPEVVFRAQPHGTFKFLFNGILLAGSR